MLKKIVYINVGGHNMNKIDIKKLDNGKYELYIDGKRACVGNLAAVVATLNVNLGVFDEYVKKDKTRANRD